MPSLPARVVSTYIRLVVRRRDWGDSDALARRSRRLFGAPAIYGRLFFKGLRSERVDILGVHGEWIMRRDATSDVLLYIHGGGYVSCSSVTHRPITASLARSIGCRVFSADYRTAPEAKFPAALEDVISIYNWLRDKTEPGKRIAIAGDSAGGGLALALAVHARDAGSPPACIVMLSPWTDLAGTGAAVHANDGRCAMFRPENIAAFASAYLGTASPGDPRASPIYADLHGLPPVLIQASSTELLLDDARRVHDGIIGSGESRLTVYDVVSHGWQLLTPFIPEARSALHEIATFVQKSFS